MDIGVKETGLAANKDENVDKVAHTSPVIGNQKSKLEDAQWYIGCIGSCWGYTVVNLVSIIWLKSCSDLDISLKETGLAVNKVKNTDSVAHNRLGK